MTMTPAMHCPRGLRALVSGYCFFSAAAAPHQLTQLAVHLIFKILPEGLACDQVCWCARYSSRHLEIVQEQQQFLPRM